MCTAKVCTFPVCSHIRITPELCDWVLSNRGSTNEYLKRHHPKPIVWKQAEDPTNSICLCELGIPLKYETRTGLTATLVYRHASEEDLQTYAQMVVAYPVWKAMLDAKIGPSGEEETIPVTETGLSPSASGHRIHVARRLWVTGGVCYGGTCTHGERPLAEAKELGGIPIQCPESGCEGLVMELRRVTDREPVPGGASLQSQGSAGADVSGFWNIFIDGTWK